MNPSKSKQRGFTLIELLLWMLLSAILFAAIGNYYSATIQSWLFTSKKYETRQAASLLTNDLVSNIRFGDNYVILPNYPNSNSGQAIQFTSSSDGTTIETIYLDSLSQQVMMVTNTDTKPKALSGQTANIRIVADSAMFLFHADSNSIEIQFTITNTQNKENLAIKSWATSVKSIFN